MTLGNTVEPLLRGHPFERPPPLERPFDIVNLKINVLILTPDERPPLLKGHFSCAKGVASQEGFHCILNLKHCSDGRHHGMSDHDFRVAIKIFSAVYKEGKY